MINFNKNLIYFFTFLILLIFTLYLLSGNIIEEYFYNNLDLDTIYNKWSYLYNTNLPIINTKNKSIKKNNIFISIANYRDPEIIDTLDNIITNAQYPNNLTIYIYQQIDPNNDINANNYINNTKCNLIIKTVHYNDAKGPSWARYLIQNNWNGEEYFLQIDSHTKFIKNWDTILINMINKLPNKSVLTQYPPDYNKDGTYDINKLRSGLYVECFRPIDNFTRIQSEYYKGKNKPKEIFKSEAWGACFSFSRYTILEDAPYDPYLFYLFFGEEMDITIRLYSKGWKFYSPNISLVFTNFNRSHRRTIWEDHEINKRKEIELLSKIRLYYKFNMKEQLDKYKFDITKHNLLIKNINKVNLGNIKTIKDYEDYAGIDIKNQTVKNHNRKRIIEINRYKQLSLNNIWFTEVIMYHLKKYFYIN